VYDMKGRLVTTPGRITFSSDGWAPYVPAMRAAFGLRVDYGQVQKQYGHKNRDDHRYEPARHADFIRKVAILGAPSFERLSTSLVERQNLTIRMHVRRLTRLVNGFSKKRRNHGAALALHFAWYNFVRIHEALDVTPAMAAGITDHLWDIEELVAAALAEPPRPTPPTGSIPSPDGWTPPEQLGLFDRVPGLAGLLLPPSVGGTPSSNDNAGPTLPGAPEVPQLPEVGADEGEDDGEPEAGDEDEGPATVRDPAQKWATLEEEAAPTAGWATLEGGADRLG
jgi:hypothetical protein